MGSSAVPIGGDGESWGPRLPRTNPFCDFPSFRRASIILSRTLADQSLESLHAHPIPCQSLCRRSSNLDIEEKAQVAHPPRCWPTFPNDGVMYLSTWGDLSRCS